MRPRNKTLKLPLTAPELRQLYHQNPTPELARALWEIARLKRQIELFSEQYVQLVAMWPPDTGGRPVLLETLKSQMLTEVREAWPPSRREAAMPDFTKGTIFEDLDDEHPEDRWLEAQLVRMGKKPQP